MSIMHRRVALLLAIGLLLLLSAVSASSAETSDGVGVVDTTSGLWYLRDPVSGDTTSFYFGNPGDEPFMGDWDCDGVDTPGLHRRADGYVYLRNSNTQGVADVAFYFGNPGDIALAGDFDANGCDSVSLYRPSEGVFYIMDHLGEGDAGLGAATRSFAFGDIGDQPLAGDFNGDGIDTVGIARAGIAHFSVDLPPNTDVEQVTFGSAADNAVVGAWAGGADLVAGHPQGGGGFRLVSADGGTVEHINYGHGAHLPVAGHFGVLVGGSESPPDQQPYPDVGFGKRIIYSNGEQRVWLVEADDTLAKTHLVSGKEGVPANGVYSVFSKSVQARSFKGITMTHMVRFARGAKLPYGFRSIPLYADGRPLQTEAELGSYRSAGCVRQVYDDAVFLFDWAPIGTTVHVIP